MNAELGPNDLDLPFEPTDPMPMADQANAIVCGGVVVRAATVDVPDAGMQPALVWQFVQADGHFLQPVLLVVDDGQMAKLRPLIFEAIARARRGAKGVV